MTTLPPSHPAAPRRLSRAAAVPFELLGGPRGTAVALLLVLAALLPLLAAAQSREDAASFVVQVLQSCTTRDESRAPRAARGTPLREVRLDGSVLSFGAGFYLVSVDLAGAATRLVDDNGQPSLELVCKVPSCNVGRGNVVVGEGDEDPLWRRHQIRFVCGDEFNPRLKKALDFYIEQQPAPRSLF